MGTCFRTRLEDDVALSQRTGGGGHGHGHGGARGVHRIWRRNWGRVPIVIVPAAEDGGPATYNGRVVVAEDVCSCLCSCSRGRERRWIGLCDDTPGYLGGEGRFCVASKGCGGPPMRRAGFSAALVGEGSTTPPRLCSGSVFLRIARFLSDEARHVIQAVLVPRRCRASLPPPPLLPVSSFFSLPITLRSLRSCSFS